MIDLLGPALAFALATSSVTGVADSDSNASENVSSEPSADVPASAADPIEAVPDAATPERPSLISRSLVQEDLSPTVDLLRTKKLSLRIGGLVQIHGAALAGKDSLVSNGDLAAQPGFRIRRARIGVEGQFGEKLGVLLGVNLLDDGDGAGALSNAKLSYDFQPWLGFTIGTGKVAFSRGALMSSRELVSLERAQAITEITPSRRLGVTAEGRLFEGKVAYLASVMNGTEGFALGNQFGGLLYGARAEYAPLGAIRYGEIGASGISIGGSALQESGPIARRTAASVDLLAAFRGASVLLEGLCDRSTPIEAALVSPGLPAALERCGGYAEAAYAFRAFELPLQLAARTELFDDNRTLEDAGDALVVSGGVNLWLFDDHARAQLHYVSRTERFGLERDNNALVLSMQGSF